MANVDKEVSLSVENIIEEPLLGTVVVLLWTIVVLDEAKLVVFVLGWRVGPRVVEVNDDFVVGLEIGSVVSTGLAIFVAEVVLDEL